MEPAIRELLTTNPAVSALIGSRVYPLVAPANAELPYIEFSRAGGANISDLSGRSALNKGVYDLRCIAATPKAAAELGDAVEIACDVSRRTLGGLEVDAVDVVDSRDDPGQGKDSTGTAWARVVSISGFWKRT